MFIIKKRAVKKRKQKAKEVERTAEPDGQNGQPMDGTEATQDPSQQDEQQQEVQENAHEDDDDEMNDIPTHTLKEHQFVFQDFERVRETVFCDTRDDPLPYACETSHINN